MYIFFCLILYFIIKLFQLKTQVLTTVAEMLKNIEIIRFLYPDFSLEKYESYLKEMVPHTNNWRYLKMRFVSL
jgi:hypothetical protein